MRRRTQSPRLRRCSARLRSLSFLCSIPMAMCTRMRGTGCGRRTGRMSVGFSARVSVTRPSQPLLTDRYRSQRKLGIPVQAVSLGLFGELRGSRSIRGARDGRDGKLPRQWNQHDSRSPRQEDQSLCRPALIRPALHVPIRLLV